MPKIISVMKGGGGSAHSPVEMDDNLISKDKIKILLALSDGETVDETPQSLPKCVLLNDVPIVSSNGTVNYPGVNVEYRSGTQAQEYIQGFTESNNEITVQRPLTTETPFVISATNQNLSAIRVRIMTSRLAKQLDNGDTVGTRVDFRIDMAVDGSSYQTAVTDAFDGKNTSGYDRSIRVNLPQNYRQVLLRVVRVTPDSTTDRVQDEISVQSYSEVIDAKFRYPLTALLFIELGSDLFPNQLPTISLLKKWKKVLVPTNYNPDARTYSGTWDGTFKLSWTNNPAWVLYDLIINQRYGLDQRELGISVDKWSLYEAAQYCDQMVPDGKGGTEPRYLCDMVVQSQVEAYTLIRDMCSIFRGLSFYNGEGLSIIIDRPRDPVYLFTNDNVVQGKFARTFASDKSLYTSCEVMFDDAQNMYNQDVEVVFDTDAARRFGNNPTQITAIGCTRRSEANRRGRWIVKTNLRSGTVSFATGLEGMIPMIGDVIAVADADWQSAAVLNLSGRVMEVSGLQVFTSFRVDARPGDFIMVNKPDGALVKRTISSVTPDGKTINLNIGFGFQVEPDAVFAIERTDLVTELYVVTKIEKGSDDEEFVHNITAVEYDPGKYDSIDYGVVIDDRPTSVVDPDVMKAPENVKVTSFSRVVQGMSVETMVISWDKVQYAQMYEVQWRKDGNNWQNAPRTPTTEVELEGIYAGAYEARVRSVSAAGTTSPWSDIAAAGLTGKIGKPNKPINLTASTDEVFGIMVKWGFPENSGDTAYTELQQSPDGTEDNATLITLVPYPQGLYWHSILPSGYVDFYRVRTVDKIGNASDWTDFVRGMATDDVDAISEVVKIDIENSDAFKDLAKDIQETQQELKSMTNQSRANAESAIENALANNTDVLRMAMENGKRKAEYRTAVKLIADEKEARVSAITQLSAEFDEAINGSITRLDEAIANETEARTQAIEQLKSQIDEDITAEIETIQETVTNLESSTAQSLQTINARFDTNESTITNLQQTVSDNEQSTATALQNLESSLGDDINAIAQTKVNTYATENGTVGASYAVNLGAKVNGTYLQGGMTIAIDNSNGTPKARTFFDVDQFAVGRVSNGGVGSLPFFIEGNQVYIQSAVIKDGSISNAMIGNYIQSNNYQAGVTGWRLDKVGNFENNGYVPDQGRMTITNNQISVYDGNGVLRARMGQL